MQYHKYTVRQSCQRRQELFKHELLAHFQVFIDWTIHFTTINL